MGDAPRRLVLVRSHGRDPAGSLMKILDRLPIPEKRSSLRFGGRFATIRRDQILVWVSVHLSGVLEPEETHPQVPSLAGHRKQLRLLASGPTTARVGRDRPRWTGGTSDIEINAQVVGRRVATVWLYPNIPGRQEVANDRPPFRLEMKQRNRYLPAGRDSSRPAAASARASRPPRQRPRLVARS